MTICDYNLLEYLHDALLLTFSFFVGKDDLRQCELMAVCDEECGYDAWAGKTVQVSFNDVLLVNGSFLGHVSGPEYINSIDTGLLPGARQEIEDFIREGISEPKVELTIVLQSGSEFSLACDIVEVAVHG